MGGEGKVWGEARKAISNALACLKNVNKFSVPFQKTVDEEDSLFAPSKQLVKSMKRAIETLRATEPLRKPFGCQISQWLIYEFTDGWPVCPFLLPPCFPLHSHFPLPTHPFPPLNYGGINSGIHF